VVGWQTKRPHVTLELAWWDGEQNAPMLPWSWRGGMAKKTPPCYPGVGVVGWQTKRRPHATAALGKYIKQGGVICIYMRTVITKIKRGKIV
jgi:hypothetical protein